VETTIENYVKAEISKVNANLKKYLTDQLNNAIAEHS